MEPFTLELLKRSLTIPEAACLWCSKPFSVLDTSEVILLGGGVMSAQHPDLQAASEVLVEATNSGELPAGENEDGYPVAIQKRRIHREDLAAWIAEHFPAHRPPSLFPGGVAVTVGERRQEVSGVSTPSTVLPASIQANDRLLSSADVRAMFGISAGTIDNWTAAKGFPKPIQAGAGTKRMWSLAALLVWKNSISPAELHK